MEANNKQFMDSVIALAAILQAALLIRELTQTGKVDDTAFLTSIYSIFQTDPVSTVSTFGNLSGLKLGVQTLARMFDSSLPKDKLLQRYLLSLLSLQKKLYRSPKMLSLLAQRLAQAKKQVEYFHLAHPLVISNLADIYLSTISTFKFRILILGNQRILHVKENMEKIRALLLAGIRATTLWRQVGGSRWHLLFAGSKIKYAAEILLKDYL